ncbi:trypsin [Corynebacterium sp. LK29]|uniref:trypsin-like serine protease n=1 Tax=unclassified Corynebacterium TaxID=2624378 RepID=UPI0008A23725|nr:MULTISPECIES: trypsin-like serine protease [unclassified Corynebacterium]MBC6832370.1 trypsin [Corynebacterium sp. LK29]OFO25147.1 trypsin [Corynebacterium sp. HMSC064E07]
MIGNLRHRDNRLDSAEAREQRVGACAVSSAKPATTVAAAAVTAGLLLTGVPSAAALVGGEAAAPSVAADSVVSIMVQTSPHTGNFCTGTAIAPQWVMTAAHCVRDVPQQVGEVEVGFGSDARRVPIDRWEIAPTGDVALVHLAGDAALPGYPAMERRQAFSEQETAGTVYGRSLLGDVADGTLPSATVTASMCPVKYQQCVREDSVLARMERPAALQVGDSGGPLFIDGQLAAVFSGAVAFDGSVAPEESGYYLYTTTSSVAQWADGVMSQEPSVAFVE